MWTVSLTIWIVAWICQDHGRTSVKAVPIRGSAIEQCHWMNLKPLADHESSAEVVFEVVDEMDRDGKLYDTSGIRHCDLMSVNLASSVDGGLRNIENEGKVLLSSKKSDPLQVSISREFERILDNNQAYLLLSLACGKERVCIQFPGRPGIDKRGGPQYLSRKILSFEGDGSSEDSYEHYAMVAIVGLAGIILLIIAGGLCTNCAEHEKPAPSLKLLSLSQTSLAVPIIQEPPGDGTSNHQALVDDSKKVKSEEKREEIVTVQETQVNSRSNSDQLNCVTTECDVRNSEDGHATRSAEHVVTIEKKEGEDGVEASHHDDASEVPKGWKLPRLSKKGQSESVKDEAQKEKKTAKKSKLSFMKAKRPTVEIRDTKDEAQHVEGSLSGVDRPRIPLPQEDHHSRQLPAPPPGVKSVSLPRPLPERQRFAPSELGEENDQYETVQVWKKRSASANQADDSYTTADFRVKVDEELGKDRPVSTGNTCTYDSIGGEPSSRPASELYEVVQFEEKATKPADLEEDDTYEIVGEKSEKKETKNRGSSACDVYEEVIREPVSDANYAQVLKGPNSKVKNAENSTVGETESSGDATEDQLYEEVQKDEVQGGKTDAEPDKIRKRPPLFKHPSTPDLVCEEAKRRVAARSNSQRLSDSSMAPPPPAPSLNHLREITGTGRPRTLSEGGHFKTNQRLNSTDESPYEEVTQKFDYTYTEVNLSQKTKFYHGEMDAGHEGEVAQVEEEKKKKGEEISEGDPPPLPPIYVSLPKKEDGEGKEEAEEGSSENKSVEQSSEAPSEDGLYDEVGPSSSGAAVIQIGHVTQSARAISASSVDSDYEAVEDIVPYVKGAPGPDASTGSSKGKHETATKAEGKSNREQTEDEGSGYEAVIPLQATINAAASRSTSANGVRETSLLDDTAHYEPVETRTDNKASLPTQTASDKILHWV